MKRFLLISMLFLPGISVAGTINTYFNPLGTISFSSGTASSVQSIAVTSQTASGSSVSTWAMNCQGGNLLVVGYTTDNGTLPSGITYNSVSMTYSTQTTNGAGPDAAALYYLTSPAAGTNNIVITGSGGNTYSGGICFSGTHSASPIDTQLCNTSGGGTGTISLTMTTANNNDWMADVAYNNGTNDETATSPQTDQWHGFSGFRAGAGSTKGPLATGVISSSWTATSFSQPVICGLAIIPGP